MFWWFWSRGDLESCLTIWFISCRFRLVQKPPIYVSNKIHLGTIVTTICLRERTELYCKMIFSNILYSSASRMGVWMSQNLDGRQWRRRAIGSTTHLQQINSVEVINQSRIYKHSISILNRYAGDDKGAIWRDSHGFGCDGSEALGGRGCVGGR